MTDHAKVSSDKSAVSREHTVERADRRSCKKDKMVKKKKVRRKEEITGISDPIKKHGVKDCGENIDGGLANISSETANDDKCEDWFSPLHHIGGQDRAKKLKILEARGITPAKGKWSAKELNQLHENIMNFLLSNEVKDFKRLIIPASPEDRKFRIDTQFGYKMCKGIRRTYNNILLKVGHQYSKFLTQGAYSDMEKKKLLELRKMGKSWKEIGLTMNRMHIGMSTKHYRFSKSWNKGPWTREEDHLLHRAVVMFKLSFDYYGGGTWNDVSEMVGTRPPQECHLRWKSLSKCEDFVFEKQQFRPLAT